MADSYNVGQVFGSSAQGMADAAVAMPMAKLDLASKQMAVDKQADDMQTRSQEKSDLAKLAATDPAPQNLDPTSIPGMKWEAQHLQKLISTQERDGDGIGANQSRERLNALQKDVNAAMKTEQEQKMDKLGMANQMFVGIDSEEALKSFKARLPQYVENGIIDPQMVPMLEQMDLPGAKAAALKTQAGIKLYEAQIRQQTIDEKVREDKARDEQRKEDGERANRRTAEKKELDYAKLKLSEVRVNLAKTKAAGTNGDEKELKYERSQAQKLVADQEKVANSAISELAKYSDPTFATNLPKDERKAQMKELEETIRTAKATADETRKLLKDTAPEVLKKLGPKPGTASVSKNRPALDDIFGK